MKTCARCGKDKSRDQFAKCTGRYDGLQTYCRDCHAKIRKEYNERNPESLERRRKYAREYQRNKRIWLGPSFQRFQKNAALGQYGIGIETFDRMLHEQRGRCAICGNEPKEGQNLHVDHCHKTGKVRALLCRYCNPGLGYFKDSPEILRKAALYLESC